MRRFKFLLMLAVGFQTVLAISLIVFRLPKDPSLWSVLPFIILAFALLDFGGVGYAYFKKKLAMLKALQDDTGKRLDELEEYYKGIKEENREIRKLGHDIDNIILSVVVLIEQGDSESAKAVLEQVTAARKASRTLTLCGNHVANSVLLTKAVEAERMGIKFFPDVRLDEDCPVPPITIMRIFTNVLDNAIHGAAQTVNQEPMIRIASSIKSGIFLVNCINTTGPPAKRSKESAGYHGLGTSILKDLAADNGGSCVFSEIDTYFQVKLSLIANQAEFDKAKELEGKIEYLSSMPKKPLESHEVDKDKDEDDDDNDKDYEDNDKDYEDNNEDYEDEGDVFQLGAGGEIIVIRDEDDPDVDKSSFAARRKDDGKHGRDRDRDGDGVKDRRDGLDFDLDREIEDGLDFNLDDEDKLEYGYVSDSERESDSILGLGLDDEDEGDDESESDDELEFDVLNPDVLNPGEEEGLDQAEGESEFEEIEIVADDDDLDESPDEPKLDEIEIAGDALDESSDKPKLGEIKIAGDDLDEFPDEPKLGEIKIAGDGLDAKAVGLQKFLSKITNITVQKRGLNNSCCPFPNNNSCPKWQPIRRRFFSALRILSNRYCIITVKSHIAPP